jgi:phosphopantothenoylcysteine decarboxylase/phosphopantothenate--cysteine ligase
MTPASKDFVTHLHYPLSKIPVYSSFYNDDEQEAEWNNHVELVG